MKNTMQLALIVLAVLPASAQKGANPNGSGNGDDLIASAQDTLHASTDYFEKSMPTCKRFPREWKPAI